jgi:hypothetical protein
VALRAYLLLSLEPGCQREEIVRIADKIEAFPDVLFVEAVTGAYDLLVTAESVNPVEQLVNEVRELAGVRDVLPLKARPILRRERMWRNLSDIPLSRGS